MRKFRARLLLLTILIAAGWLVACRSTHEATPSPTQQPQGSDEPASPTPEPAATNTPTFLAEPSTEAEPTLAPEPTAAEITEPSPTLTSQPIEVTYFTPAQQEGPYYPVDKPDDRDNDLVELAGAAADPAGEVLALSGLVYDENGLPFEGALIQIWQTDANGIYRHPNDPNTNQRDPNFQFYGEAVTGPDGLYSFRTIIPGRYEPRPRHIHVKIFVDEVEVLTTQFYFGNEVSFSGAEANLVIDLAQAEDDAGNPIWIGERDVILSPS